MISSGDLVKHHGRGFGLWNKRRFQSTEQDRIRLLIPGELALVICLFNDKLVDMERDDNVFQKKLTYTYVLVLVSNTCELGWTDIHAWEAP